MKKIIFKLTTALLVISMLTSCDKEQPEDSTVDLPVEGETVQTTQATKENDVVAVYPYADVYDSYPEIVIEASKTVRNNTLAFNGIGLSLTNQAVDSLLYYKEQSENSYNEILKLLFSNVGGVGFSHITLPLSDETNLANVEAAADALAANPDLRFELAYEGTETDFDARISQILKLISACREKGVNINYLSVSDSANAEWIKHLSASLAPVSSVDVKIIVKDPDGSFSDSMMQDIALLDAIDIVSGNISNENALQLSEKYNKEIWSYINAADYPQADQEKPNVALADDIIRDLNYKNATMFVIENPLQASSSVPSLIITDSPATGTIKIDISLWYAANISLLVGKGYLPVTTGGYEKVWSDDFQFAALTNPDTGDYTVVMVNRNPRAAKFTFTTKGFEKEDSLLHVWETAGILDDSDDYYQNFFRSTEDFYPEEFGLDKYFAEQALYENILEEMEEGEEEPVQIIPYSFSLTINPLSVVTVSTNNIYELAVDTWDVYSTFSE